MSALSRCSCNNLTAPRHQIHLNHNSFPVEGWRAKPDGVVFCVPTKLTQTDIALYNALRKILELSDAEAKEAAVDVQAQET